MIQLTVSGLVDIPCNRMEQGTRHRSKWPVLLPLPGVPALNETSPGHPLLCQPNDNLIQVVVLGFKEIAEEKLPGSFCVNGSRFVAKGFMEWRT